MHMPVVATFWPCGWFAVPMPCCGCLILVPLYACVWLDFHCINMETSIFLFTVPVLGMFIDTHCDYLNGAVVVLVLGMWLA